MKKILSRITIVLVLLLLALVSLPFLFKDKIKAKINETIASQVNAQVYYGDLSLSLLKHFPTLTVSLQNFGVVGNSPFKGDTLLQAQRFDVSLDLVRAFSGDYQVNSLGLIAPKILVKVLPNGEANYDVFKKKDADNQTDTTKTTFNAQIKSWEISEGSIVYDDRKTPAFVSLQNINHEGSGNLSQSLYDLATNTQIGNASLSYAGKEYLKDRKLSADLTLTIDNNKKQYTFKDNKLSVNDFVLNVEGWLQRPDTSTTTMDLRFASLDNDFKSLLSLVPALYTQQFGDLKAEGKASFDGFAKGTLKGQKTPTFDINLLVENGQFKYPDLPTPVSDVQVDLHIKNATESLENTVIDLKKMTMNIGSNPLKAKALVEGLTSRKVNADVVAKMNLEEVSKIFPVKGLTMRGLYNLDLKAKGQMDKQHFPVVNAAMTLANGYIKSDKLPEPLENLQVSANVVNGTGQVADTQIKLNDLKMVLAGEPFQANGLIQNLSNYNWDIKAKGILDLTKITQIYPLADMTLSGKINADIESKGTMTALKAKQYAQLPTSGMAQLQNFAFASKTYPQGIKIKEANLSFSPQNINVINATGYLGSSDFKASGTMSNYLGYALNNETIKGNFKVQSDRFNVNEWMTDKPVKGQEQPLQVVEVPKNIDFSLDSEIGEVLYDRMKMSNVKGGLVVGNGAVKMQNVAFNSLGGRFVTSGTYNTQDMTHPLFDFSLSLDNIEIAQAHQNLSVVKALLPIAEYVIGNVSSKFAISGELQQDMMPNLSTLTGQGLVKILKATLSNNNNIIARFVETTKIKALENAQIKDALMQTEIKDGKLKISPFDIKIDEYKINVGGMNALDGGIDYNLKLDIPTGKVGNAFSSAFMAWTGKTLAGTDRVKFDLKLGGTLKSPKFSFNGSSTANTLKDAATAELEAAKAKALDEANKLKAQAEEQANKLKAEIEAKKAELEQQKADLEAKALAEKERLIKEAEAKKAELEAKAKAYADSLKRAATERAKRELEKQKNAILDNLFKKKQEPKTEQKKDSV